MSSLTIILLISLITNVLSDCQGNGTRFGLPWDNDLVSLSIKRYIDANPEIKHFDGCKRKELQLPKLAERFGYNVEIHNVITKDGYILEIHRIFLDMPTGNKPVILFQHGILMSSAAWTTSKESPAFFFVERGFDVWLANSRGNVYGQDHIDTNKTSQDFWDFSFDEMIEYDLPATFDKIHQATGQNKLWYIGHSQGATIMLAKLATDPDFHKRLHSVFALAPVISVQNIRGTIPIILNTRALINPLKSFYIEEGEMQLPVFSKEIMLLTAPTCLLFPNFCSQLMFFFVGYSNQYNKTNSLTHVSITPEGTSIKNAWHWKQVYENGKFGKFDYNWKGVDENRKRYNQENPPIYDLSQIKHASIYVYSGNEDELSDELDLMSLFEQLSDNVLRDHKHLSGFSHVDFLWGNYAIEQIYWPILRTIESNNIKKI